MSRPETSAATPVPVPDGLEKLNISVVVACNDEAVLRNSLLSSPGLRDVREVIIQRGFPSAAAAYNQGLAKASGEIVVFVHQDVFLPSEWATSFSAALAALEKTDPNWGVLGVWGISPSGAGVGHVHSTGMERTLGGAFQLPIEVKTLDEVLLVLRRATGLCFDDKLTGFHLYGTDICLQSNKRNLKNYVISAFCVHNTNGIRWLPVAYWKALFYLRRKWRGNLPVHSPCMRITKSNWPIVHYACWKTKAALLGTLKAGKRSENPGEVYRKIVSVKKP